MWEHLTIAQAIVVGAAIFATASIVCTWICCVMLYEDDKP
jgi:hypothetical protein